MLEQKLSEPIKVTKSEMRKGHIGIDRLMRWGSLLEFKCCKPSLRSHQIQPSGETHQRTTLFTLFWQKILKAGHVLSDFEYAGIQDTGHMALVVVENQKVAKSGAAVLGAGDPEACSQVWRLVQGQVRLVT